MNSVSAKYKKMDKNGDFIFVVLSSMSNNQSVVITADVEFKNIEVLSFETFSELEKSFKELDILSISLDMSLRKVLERISENELEKYNCHKSFKDKLKGLLYE